MDKVLLALGSVSMFFSGHAFCNEEFFFSIVFVAGAVFIYGQGMNNS